MWYAYDIECYPDFFSIIFINIAWKHFDSYIKADIDKNYRVKELLIETGIESDDIYIYVDIGQSEPIINELVTFLEFKVEGLFAYNNHEYDDLLLNFILKGRSRFHKRYESRNKDIHRISSFIIDTGNRYAARSALRLNEGQSQLSQLGVNTVDLMSLHYLNVRKISLKQTAINMQWHRIQDLPIPPNSSIAIKDRPDILDYNFNDVLIVIRLFYYGIEEFNLRLRVGKTHSINVSSDARSKMGDKIFIKLYEKASGLKKREFAYKKTDRRRVNLIDIISYNIKFETKQLQDLVEKLKAKSVIIGDDNSKSSIDEEVLIGDSKYAIKLGGLHAKDTPDIFNATDKYKLIDADVASFYTNLIVNEKVCPAHLDILIFIAVIEHMTKERIAFKDEDDEFNADAMKIALNNIFGKLGFEFGSLFDLKALYKTTVNGQLYILMLVEDLELAKFRVISANTDGVVAQVPPEREDEYKAICNRWSKINKFDLSFVYYKKYVRQSVNDYISLRLDGTIKAKGVLSPKLDLTKGYYAPIIKKAAIDFLLYDKNVDDTLYNHDNIYDFCISQKVGSQFASEAHSIIEGNRQTIRLQKNIRYFVSNYGVVLMKRHLTNTSTIPGKTNKNKIISLVKGVYCTVFNDYFRVESMKDYDINYKFYKRKVYEILYKVNRADMKDIRAGLSGNLFNDI